MRIAQITDIHIFAHWPKNPLRFFGKRSVGAVNLIARRRRQYPKQVVSALVNDLNRAELDHLIVSGDLTNLSLPSEYQAAREVLEGVTLPYHDISVVPGNHDWYVRGQEPQRAFEREFAPYIQSDWPGPRAYPFVRVRDGVAVIGVSSACPSLPFLAIGTVGRRQLEALERLLQDPRLDGLFKIVAVHHPPHLYPGTRMKRLTDGEAVTSVLARAGVDLVVHGHLHKNLLHKLEGRVPLLGSNSSTWLAPKESRVASYPIFVFDGPRLTAIERRRYDATRDDFVAWQSFDGDADVLSSTL